MKKSLTNTPINRRHFLKAAGAAIVLPTLLPSSVLGRSGKVSLEQPGLNTRMLTGFALVALLLASVGLYGLVSLAVASRTREIGVRMALGAGAGQIVRHVAAGVARLLAVGLLTGFLLTLLADRVLRSVLFGVSPLDPLTLAGAILTLFAVSAFATFAPARRAARIHPIEAIRTE